MNFPEELKYTKDHEWIRVNGNEATVGITDFAQSELGDIVFIDVTSIGQEVKQGGQFGTVEAVKTVSDMFMPVSGKVTEVNPKLDANSELVNSDPYGDGWVVKIAMSNLSELDNLLTADGYKKEIGQ